MYTAEKLCLQWNDFKESVQKTIANLRVTNEFTDVTLATEGGEKIEAHKVILASSSQFFENLLQKNHHPHPLICLRGVTLEHLSAILDFLYFGRTNVFAEKNQEYADIQDAENNKEYADIVDVKNNQKTKETDIRKATKETVNSDRKPALFETSLSDQQGGVNYFELDKQIESMNRTTGKIFACKVCGKEGSRKDIVRHIESLHISGVSHNCDFCDKATRSRDAMKQHKRTHSLATAKN